MKIVLTRTGGFIPVKKRAETDVEWTEEDMNELKKIAPPPKPGPGSIRDGVGYILQCGEDRFVIEWQKIPEKFKSTLEKLKDNLTIEKP